MRDETKCLHAGYTPGNTEPRVLPIVQSTTYVFDSAEDISAVFDDPTKNLIYSRFANPTVMAVEAKIAELEGGIAAMCTSSGQAATLFTILALCEKGDSLVCTNQVYGGTLNLFSYTLPKYGIECVFIDCNASNEEIEAAIQPSTKLIYAESLANPALSVLDIRRFAGVAHKNGLPLVIDNTFATPILCKPIQYGADIVLHSTSKYMDGHAVQVGGVIVDSGNFDWAASGRFPALTTPDESYHGIIYTETYGKAAFILKARMQLMRDFGAYPAAHSAFLLNLGLETLALRMERYCQNAQAVAEFFAKSDLVEAVRYPGLETDPYHARAKEYLKGCSGVISLVLKGGSEKAITFMNALKLASKEVHVADIRTCVLHPASTTHRQVPEELLPAAGVQPGLVRVSVGLENIEDILDDFRGAFAAIR